MVDIDTKVREDFDVVNSFYILNLNSNRLFLESNEIKIKIHDKENAFCSLFNIVWNVNPFIPIKRFIVLGVTTIYMCTVCRIGNSEWATK